MLNRLLIFLLTQLLVLLFSHQGLALRVLIDPGHGGHDNGAVRGQLTESEIALQVSLELKRLLMQSGRYQPQLTREDSRYLSLQERAQMANNVKPDVFLSVHVNASEDPRARGVEFYFQNQLEPTEEMLLIAKTENQINQSLRETQTNNANKGDVLSILEDLNRQQKLYKSLQLAKKLKASWPTKYVDQHAVKQAPFFVVSNTESPSILVELGFLSNPEDFKKLSDPNQYALFAKRIFEGLEKYKQVIDKETVSNLH